jgi:ribonuclease HII
LILNNLTYEENLWQQGYKYVAGMDEAGRGPLAGPVVACAVIFEQSFYDSRVRDSKKLSAARRGQIFDTLMSRARDVGIGTASVAEIETHNIRQATFLAMGRAIGALKIRPDYVLVDGESIPQIVCPAECIIAGDEKSFTISAASIIAKVTRDKYMQELDLEYPDYKFAKNKGYGTAEHIRAIRQSGPSPHHRYSFLKKIL